MALHKIVWGFVPQSNFDGSIRDSTRVAEISQSRLSDHFVPQGVDENYIRRLDFKNSPGRTQTCVHKTPSKYRSKNNKCTRCRPKTMYFRRNRKFIRKACHRDCSQDPGRSGVLQHLFCCSKTRRRLPSDSQFETVKYISPKSTFQDGVSKVSNTGSECRRLGGINRSKGCISTCSNLSRRQEIPQVLHRQYPLSIQVNALRSSNSPKSVYEINGGNRCTSKKSTDFHLHVPGRLASQKCRSNDISSSTKENFVSADGLGPGNKSIQVNSAANATDNLSWSTIQPPTGYGLPQFGPFSQSVWGNFYHGYGIFYPSTYIPQNPWFNGSLYRFGTSCQTQDASHSVLPSVPVASTCGRTGSSDSNGQFPHPTSSLVDRERECSGRNVYSELQSRPNLVDGCINLRVGSPPRGSQCVGEMDGDRTVITYKSVGTQCSGECTSSLQGQCQTQASLAEDRQFNSSVLHQSPRGDKVCSPMRDDMEDSALVSPSRDTAQSSSHSREKECNSGSVVQRATNSQDDRMESQPRNSSADFSSFSHSKHRFIRNKGKPETSSVLFSVSRPLGMGMRCASCRLDRNVCICISASHINSESTQESGTGVVCSSPHRSVFTKTVMVSRPTTSIGRHSKGTSNNKRHVDSKKRAVHSSKSRKSASGGLENFKQQRTENRFSEKAKSFIFNSRRQSTRKMYDARIRIYKEWCAKNQKDSVEATVADLADFFIYLHEERNCKPNTLMGYRSAIASMHKGWSNSSVSNNTDLSKLIKGIYNSEPNVRPLLPNWDLPTVLWKLCDSPFEPMNSCDMKYLTWKTVFLVALATASRVSEIQALSIGESHLRLEQNGIRLLPNIQFLAKTQRLGKPWKPIFIPEFNSFATDSRDLLLCPCRALKMYLKRTESSRGDEKCLFLTYKSDSQKPASKNSISRWIVSLVKFVYEHNSETLSHVRAHDTRRLATSWALFNGATLEEILQTAHWATENTFTSFYMRDVPQGEARFAKSSVLDTSRWAKEKEQK